MAEAQPRKLQKSRTDRMLFGVAGGLAQYLDFDAVLVRVAIVVLCFAGGLGIIAYIALALVMPESPQGSGETSSEETPDASLTADLSSSTQRNRTIIGGILIAIGVIFLFQQLNFFGWLRWDLLWPLIIIGIGLSLVWNRVRR